MNTNNVLVSVITPMYNSANTIIPCIESALKQTYKNLEVIVIDDGSKDNSTEIVREFIHDNKLYNVILLQQENQGPSAARNNGIKHAKGELIAFLDSDDQWLPNKLQEQIEQFKTFKDLSVLGSKTNIYKGEQDHKCKDVSFRKLLFKDYLLTSTVICKRDIIINYLFNQDQKYSEDYRTWLHIASEGHKCMVLNTIHTQMNNKPIFGGSGLSGKLWLMEKGELSNYYFLLKEKKISFSLYITISFCSFCKFIRRELISFNYRLHNKQKSCHKKLEDNE